MRGAGEEYGEKDGAQHQENELENVRQARGEKDGGGEGGAGMQEEVRIAGVGCSNCNELYNIISPFNLEAVEAVGFEHLIFCWPKQFF